MGVETEAPESAEDSPGAGGGTAEQVSADETGAPAAPWWHSPWRLLALGAAVLFLGLAAGYAFFGGDSAAELGIRRSTSGSCRTCGPTTIRP